MFPAFDEEDNIEVLLDAVMALAPKLEPDFEVIVVDDGSRDRTAELVKRRRSERLRLVRHPSNRGYGAALRSGLREAQGELVFFSDADLQFDLARSRSSGARSSRQSRSRPSAPS